MSTTPNPGPGTGPGTGAAVDAGRVLGEIVAQRRAADRAEADLLALVVCFVEQHPVTDDALAASFLRPAGRLTTTEGTTTESPARVVGLDVGVGLPWFDPVTGEVLDDQAAAVAGGAGPRVFAVAGEGTPVVAQAAVAELGAALGVPYGSALGLVCEAVELAVRLPRLWGLVQDGRLQAWRARQVARHTLGLSGRAAGFVDRHAAVPGRRNRVPGNLNGLAHEALSRFDPDTADGVQEAALVEREVCFDYAGGDSTATSRMWARLDTLDALDLDDTLTRMATTMRTFGDTSSLGVRRAHSLGMLATGQRHLELHHQHTDTPASGGHRNKVASTLYLHVAAEDLRSWADEGVDGVGRVELLGSGTLGLLRAWLQRTSGVVVRPVLDLTRLDGVDRHHPPQWMRETVIVRDGHCVFPGCGIDARGCDLDHTIAYVPLEEGGAPGQTSLENLACLCRRHHRLKTHTRWRYRRINTGPDPGHYQWTSPTGGTYQGYPTPKQ